jgi:hypothetical protein
MSRHMPPGPPNNRSKQGSGNDPAISKNGSVKKGERHPKAAEEGETVNIQQNTTNNGFFSRPADGLIQSRAGDRVADRWP